jgi:hypothetical protein
LVNNKPRLPGTITGFLLVDFKRFIVSSFMNFNSQDALNFPARLCICPLDIANNMDAENLRPPVVLLLMFDPCLSAAREGVTQIWQESDRHTLPSNLRRPLRGFWSGQCPGGTSN